MAWHQMLRWKSCSNDEALWTSLLDAMISRTRRCSSSLSQCSMMTKESPDEQHDEEPQDAPFNSRGSS